MLFGSASKIQMFFRKKQKYIVKYLVLHWHDTDYIYNATQYYTMSMYDAKTLWDVEVILVDHLLKFILFILIWNVASLPNRLSLHFCCNTPMIEVQFGVMIMKAQIHPAVYQQIRLVVMV